MTYLPLDKATTNSSVFADSTTLQRRRIELSIATGRRTPWDNIGEPRGCYICCCCCCCRWYGYREGSLRRALSSVCINYSNGLGLPGLDPRVRVRPPAFTFMRV